MKNQVTAIIAQTTFLEKFTANTISVHVETIPQNKKINHKYKSGMECTALQRVLFHRFLFNNYFFYRFFFIS